MSEFSFDSLESVERIYRKPQKNSSATLLPRGDGLWESTYSLLSLPNCIMNVTCFDGSDSEGLTISVDAGMYVYQYIIIIMLVVVTCDTDVTIIILYSKHTEQY